MIEIEEKWQEPFNYLRWYVRQRTDEDDNHRATIMGKSFYKVSLRIKIEGTADDYILAGVSCNGWIAYLIGINYSTETRYRYAFDGDRKVFEKDMLMIKMSMPEDNG